MKDSIVESVIRKYTQRSEVGQEKYNTTLDREDLRAQEWMTHLQEELMDATLYIEKLKQLSVGGDRIVISVDSFKEAQKIVIDGFVFVKFSDLNPLPF